MEQYGTVQRKRKMVETHTRPVEVVERECDCYCGGDHDDGRDDRDGEKTGGWVGWDVDETMNRWSPMSGNCEECEECWALLVTDLEVSLAWPPMGCR